MSPASRKKAEPRPPLSLVELLEMLRRDGVLNDQQSRDVEARTTTLRSRVLKERVGSVRSQAAARYEVCPAEIVAAASLPHPQRQHRRLDEDVIAEVLAAHGELT